MGLIEFSCSLHGDDTIRFESNKGSSKVDITFKRTIRVPDNGKPNFLPPDLGNFPLFKIKDYATKLPGSMVAKGGLFLPMYQREAMWINLSSINPFMIKIYCGGVNVVSGEHANEDMATKLRRQRIISSNGHLQDYVVAPSQPWVDGIAASSGLVKQFVAMPLGDGYTVEAQMTGSEVVGGLQFEITPGTYPKPVRVPTPRAAPITKDHFKIIVKTLTGKDIQTFCAPSETILNLKLRLCELEGIPVDQQRLVFAGKPLENHHTAGDYNIQKEAVMYMVLNLRGGGYNRRQFGIAAGGLIKQTIAKDTTPQDNWRRELTTVFNVQILNSALFQEVTGRAPPKSPVSAKTYAENDLPFYAMYEEPSTICGTFDQVKSIASIDGEIEKGYQYPLVQIGQKSVCQNKTGDTSIPKAKKEKNVADPDGILSSNGPLRVFRTVADLRRELSSLTVSSFDPEEGASSDTMAYSD